jgi:hypothetical protein
MTLERVWFTYYGSLGHRRVAQNGTCDFKRSNAISRTLDNVVGAPFKPKMTGVITPREITGSDPAVAKELARAFRILPITKRVIPFLAWPLRQVPHLVRGQLVPVVIYDRHFKPGHRQSH